MNLSSIKWETAQKVMELVKAGKTVYAPMFDSNCHIRDAFILEHSGYIRFNIYSHTVGKNTMSFLPDDTFEICVEED